MELHWNQEQLGHARSCYHELSLDLETVLDIQEKYRQIEDILSCGNQAEATNWKPLVASYPGLLRESEMCSPETLRARISTSAKLQAWTGKNRSELLADPKIAPLILWHDMHQLLRDLQDWRATPGTKHEQLPSFLSWVAKHRHRPGRIEWPPCAAALVSNQQQRPSQHSAYAWLARLIEISENALLERLVDRVGARRREDI